MSVDIEIANDLLFDPLYSNIKQISIRNDKYKTLIKTVAGMQADIGTYDFKKKDWLFVKTISLEEMYRIALKISELYNKGFTDSLINEKVTCYNYEHPLKLPLAVGKVEITNKSMKGYKHNAPDKIVDVRAMF